MAEKSKKNKKEDSTEVKIIPDSSLNWSELTLLIEKTVSQAVATSVSSAVNEAMTKIQTEITKISDNIISLESKFSSLSSDVTSKIVDQSNRLNSLEDQLTHLQNESEDMKETTIKLLKENSLQKVLINELEQQTRSLSLRITGLPVHPDTAIDEIITFISDKLQDIDVTAADISNVSILRKTSSNQDQLQSSPKAPTLIVTFSRKIIRDKILRGRRNLKGTHMSINEDLTLVNARFLSLHHKDPRIADMWSWNGRIFFTTVKGGKKRMAKPFLTLDEQLEA